MTRPRNINSTKAKRPYLSGVLLCALLSPQGLVAETEPRIADASAPPPANLEPLPSKVQADFPEENGPAAPSAGEGNDLGDIGGTDDLPLPGIDPPAPDAANSGRLKITIDQVFASSRDHFPTILAAVQETLVKQGEITRALGAFDLALEQDVLARTSGYYDGKAVDNRLVKRLPDANTRLYAGYRYGSDDFPVYENEYITNGGGEFNLGAVFSLWRDRGIDSRRFEVASARVAAQQAEAELLMARLMTQRNAARAYWQWVNAGLTLDVYTRLVMLAESRMDALERRAEAGDVAEIFVIENRQNLLRRQALQTSARRNFQAAGIALSMYLRDADGRIQTPEPDRCPHEFPPLPEGRQATDVVIARALSERPELQLLEFDQNLAQQRLQLARNELMPRVDLGLKAAQDLGNGSDTRRGFETKVDLTVSIPLERRRGTGSVAATESRLSQIAWETRLAEDQIRTEVERLANAIDNDIEYVQITRVEAEQARVLEEAERKRFRAGASDFFLVNLREERTADAELRNLKANLDLLLSLTDFQATAMDLAALGL